MTSFCTLYSKALRASIDISFMECIIEPMNFNIQMLFFHIDFKITVIWTEYNGITIDMKILVF